LSGVSARLYLQTPKLSCNVLFGDVCIR
jgi:hypothetical protein